VVLICEPNLAGLQSFAENLKHSRVRFFGAENLAAHDAVSNSALRDNLPGLCVGLYCWQSSRARSSIPEGLAKVGQSLPRTLQGHPVQGVNKLVEGAMDVLGPAAVTQPEALAVAMLGMIAAKIGNHVATKMGADEDVAEMIGNIAGLTAGSHVAVKLLLPTASRKSRLRVLWRRIVGLLN
jgi:hypothetical protein